MKLAGIQLGSENPKKLADFYTKALGKPSFMDEGGDWYGFDIDGAGVMIGPHSEVKGKNDCPGRIMVMLTTKDVEAEFKKWKEAGGVVVAIPYQPDKKQPDLWLATIADPDGNYVQIATPWE